MRLGLIIPHKTKVAIALWRRNTKNVPDTEPCRGLLYGLFCVDADNTCPYNLQCIKIIRAHRTETMVQIALASVIRMS
ncbi:hypothetical protein DWX90_08280 [Segatella copri]|uniref:Uncharacterized protein n=1 Tax=Segatella copri TaxID=165179 RepID=A0AA92TLI4_9BACT|nr:hypothetical protein DWX90_08280 [Segatella copri]